MLHQRQVSRLFRCAMRRETSDRGSALRHSIRMPILCAPLRVLCGLKPGCAPHVIYPLASAKYSTCQHNGAGLTSPAASSIMRVASRQAQLGYYPMQRTLILHEKSNLSCRRRLIFSLSHV